MQNMLWQNKKSTKAANIIWYNIEKSAEAEVGDYFLPTEINGHRVPGP